MDAAEVIKAIDEVTSEVERLRIEIQAIEDTPKPVDPLEADHTQ